MLHRLTPPRELPEMKSWSFVRDAWQAVFKPSLRAVWKHDSDLLVIMSDDALAGPTFFLNFANIAQFEIKYSSSEIVVRPFDDDVPNNTIEHLLVDQVWPRILAHDGDLVLHASGVANNQGAILFVGRSGQGKSTLAASLHQRGLPLIGDDAVLISKRDGEARCRAVYRSLRLFEDSIEKLFDSSIFHSDVAEYTDKQNVYFPPLAAGDEDHRVRAIFLLNSEDGHADARVTPASPSDACMRFVEHSFWLDPTDMRLTAQKLKLASALANSVPVFQLTYPRDYAKLDELHATIFSVLN